MVSPSVSQRINASMIRICFRSLLILQCVARYYRAVRVEPIYDMYDICINISYYWYIDIKLNFKVPVIDSYLCSGHYRQGGLFCFSVYRLGFTIVYWYHTTAVPTYTRTAPHTCFTFARAEVETHASRWSWSNDATSYCVPGSPCRNRGCPFATEDRERQREGGGILKYWLCRWHRK